MKKMMYVTNTVPVQSVGGIINYMPHALRKYFYSADITDAYEIHLCPGKPVTLYLPRGQYFLSQHGVLTKTPHECVRTTGAHISEAMELISQSSVYSVDNELINGYITIDGGHRIGICGSAVIREGKISFVKDISALNYRIAREINGVSDKVIDYVYSGGRVKNTLIISPPGAGKTTLLRDIVRSVSDKGIRVCVVDERCEIAAMHKGRVFFDLGISTDVFSGAPKAEGMLMMLRAMSPQVIVTDEIGGEDDVRAVEKTINSGTKIITTVHGYDLDQIQKRSDLKNLLSFFETFITLSSRNGVGTVEGVVSM